MQQISVRSVDLDDVETSLETAFDSLLERLFEILNVLLCHLLRRCVLFVERNGAGTVHVVRPAVQLLRRDVAHAEPGCDGARFAACVCELDGDFLVLGVCEFDEFAERLDLRVLPDTAIFGRDAAFGLDGSRFDKGKTRSALDNAANVGEMPVGLVTVDGGVLAKRGEL